MAKSKEDIYLERLKKWREEKQKKEEEIKKQKLGKHTVSKPRIDSFRRKTFDRKTFSATTVSQNNCKTELPKPTQNSQLKRESLKSQAKIERRKTFTRVGIKKEPLQSNVNELNRKITKTVIPLKSMSNTIKSASFSNTIKSAPKKPVADVEKKNPAAPLHGSTSKEMYLEKYEQWKKERKKTRSEKKIPQKTRQFSGNQNEKPSKPRRNILEKEETNKTKTDRGLKRRHSVALEGPPAKKKPCSILKRKSCIGFIDLDIKGSNSVADGLDDGGKAPVTPKTPSRNVRFLSPDCRGAVSCDGAAPRKTPVKKQELKNWLRMNNRTPSKFRHLLCMEHDHDHGKDPVQDVLAKVNLTVDELTRQANILELERINTEAMKKLETMLDECMTLFDAGCPVEAILPWLDDIHKKVPLACTCVKFYKCKIEVMKASLDLDALLQIIEEATINDAQPKVELAKILTETVQFITEEKVKQVKKSGRVRRRSEVQEENVFASSAIVYSVGNVTPLPNQKRPHDNASQSSDCKVVTPVRRSTRRSLQNLPDSLKDKRTLSSLEELPNKDNVLFHPNLALENALLSAEDD